MTTLGQVREVRFVEEGDEYTAEDPSGGGYYRAVATEPGFFIVLADGCLFVTEKQVLGARREAQEEGARGEVREEDDLDSEAGASRLAPGA